MGVCLSYFTDNAIEKQTLAQLLDIASKANSNYAWWCESICFSNELDDSGNAFGSSKLFRMIDDEDTDTYMVYLDIHEIVRLLCHASQLLGINWRCEIEEASFGRVIDGMPDEELQGNLAGFLEMFPGDFNSLRARTREEIFAEWPY